jgi:hypothetical protein
MEDVVADWKHFYIVFCLEWVEADVAHQLFV